MEEETTGGTQEGGGSGQTPKPEPRPPEIVVDPQIQGTATKVDKPHETRG